MPNNRILLSKRLNVAAMLVRKGSMACDVGTDHGYLAAYLIKSGISPFCVACDINEKPLKMARNTVISAGVFEQTELILSDGLKNVPSQKAQDIIICGMGGELISKIISQCSYAKDKEKHFILQPMSKAYELRKYLCESGFYLEREIPISEKGHIYTVMSVYYTGNICTPDNEFLILGKVLDETGEERNNYIKHESEKIQRVIEGLEKAGKDPEKVFELQNLKNELDILIKE